MTPPMIPADLKLETGKVLLRPMQHLDIASFFPLTQEISLWDYFTMPLHQMDALEKWVETALLERNEGKRFPFTIIEKETETICGSTSFGSISYFDKRIEIGWSWLGKNFLGTGINRHSKFALLKYAFEVLDFERVEFKTDLLNARARNGLLKIGAREEGVLRSHMIMWNNRRRDSVFYSILIQEWPEIKSHNFAGIE
jgi:RimJ/RimL family protein N-acetyltransferase